MNKANTQFSLFTLMSVVVLSAIAMGLDTWILNSRNVDAPNWFPVFYPPLSILKLSVVWGPWVGMAFFFAAIWFWAKCRPLPLSPILFVACVPMVFIAPPSTSMRMLIALLVCSGCLFIEAIARNLPSEAYRAASCCLGFTGCYYMVFTSLFAGASV